MIILITGGSGFIGKSLTKELITLGHSVIVISRNPARTRITVDKHVQVIMSLSEITKPVDVVINLAGEPIADARWSKSKVNKLYQSRIRTTEQLIEYFKAVKIKPRILISGSAIGYYGTSSDNKFTERSSSIGDGLSQDLCKKWENAALKAEEIGIRVCIIRTGIVLGRGGGVLKKMLPAFKAGLGGKFGSGLQYMSWIHMDDVTGIILHLIHCKEIKGPINLTSPNPVTNSEFSETLSAILKRPCLFTVPAIFLRLIFGRMADELLLSGQYVIPEKALAIGYQYKYPRLDSALTNILTK